MSRRNRHKKKKQYKLRQQVMSKVIAPSVPTAGVAIEGAPSTIDEAVAVTEKPQIKEEEFGSIIDAPTRKFIAKDVRMILFTLLGLAIILTAVKILQLKTGYIDNFGDWLYKVTNIQTM